MISSISFCGGKLPVTSQKLAEQKAARFLANTVTPKVPNKTVPKVLVAVKGIIKGK